MAENHYITIMHLPTQHIKAVADCGIAKAGVVLPMLRRQQRQLKEAYQYAYSCDVGADKEAALAKALRRVNRKLKRLEGR